jgi:hypothetical protein
VAALAASAAAFVIIAVAPGDSVRQSGHPRPDLGFAFTSATLDVRDFVRGFVRFSPIPALLAGALPCLVGLAAPATEPVRRRRGQALRCGARALVLLAGTAGLALLLCFMPSYYALSSPPPGRARVIAQFILVTATAIGGYVVGTLLRDGLRPAYRAATVRVAGALAEAPGARLYASQWDTIDAQIRAARASGVGDVVVPPLAPTGTVRGMDFLAPDATNWLNECAARYYRVHGLAAPRTAATTR